MVAEWVGVDGIGGIDGSTSAGGEGALADSCAGDDAAARRRWLREMPSVAVLRRRSGSMDGVDEVHGDVGEDRVLGSGVRPRPANGSRVGPPRRNSSPSSEHGALGRGSQALSAGSRLRSKAIILATNNVEQATDVTCRNLPEHAILLSTTSSRVLTEFRRDGITPELLATYRYAPPWTVSENVRLR